MASVSVCGVCVCGRLGDIMPQNAAIMLFPDAFAFHFYAYYKQQLCSKLCQIFLYGTNMCDSMTIKL